jgi:hypothetical protein
MANGRWSFAMLLCSGEDYVLVFEKVGQFGPDTVPITAQECSVSLSSSSASVSSSSSA